MRIGRVLPLIRRCSQCVVEEDRMDHLLDSLSTSIKCDSHNFLVVNPHIRWGRSSPSKVRDPQRELDEAVTLTKSIPSFRVVQALIAGTDYNTKKAMIWGSGKLEELRRIREEKQATAVMVNVGMLSPMQQIRLHSFFGVPIYDRYNMVLSIFEQYAVTEEARLQIQLAQIPYIRRRLRHLSESSHTAQILHVNPLPEKASVSPEELLRLKEQKLRKKLKEAVAKRKEGERPVKEKHATVAVVGYTNSGKTSLIKKLCSSPSLVPMDRLFATLDTSRHPARLPSGRSIVLIDTMGFLYDLPMELLDAFQMTLMHVAWADVIVHVRDASNPDWRAQDEEVGETLTRLGLKEDDVHRVIIADNKIDKEGASENDGVCRISCVTGEGLSSFISILDAAVRSVQSARRRVFDLKCDSPGIQWLYRMGLVMEEPIPIEGRLRFSVFMNDDEMQMFKSYLRSQKL